MEYEHTPVMVPEVIDHLVLKRGGYYIDCTLGSGAYTEAIAKRVGVKGKVLSFDLDKDAIENTKKRGLENVILKNDNFKNIKDVAEEEFGPETGFDGIVFDLGLSSYQLQDRTRGFSFNSDRSLNMAFGDIDSSKGAVSTEYIVNKYKEERLREVIREFGEEQEAFRIAKGIVEERKNEPIKNAKKLAQIIINSKRSKKEKIHPATKTFQALRMETNGELSNLRKALHDAVPLLNKKGRLVVVSFHSLEDRLVKNFFRNEGKDCLCPPEIPICACGHKKRLRTITKKPIEPSLEEVKRNPRSRSAKLRTAERI